MLASRWEPFRGLLTTQDLNKFFNEAFSKGSDDQESTLPAWTPAVDVYETDNSLVLKAELPGLDPKEVEIKVEDNTLHLKGERKFEKETREENYHRIERSYGSFTRTFGLPKTVDSEKAKAEFKDGVLTLTMPKREEARPKTIPINISKN